MRVRWERHTKKYPKKPQYLTQESTGAIEGNSMNSALQNAWRCKSLACERSKFLLSVFFLIVLSACNTIGSTAFWQTVGSVATKAAAPSSFEGAKIIASDGTFLGIVTSNSYAGDSILNKFGSYGSRYSSTSIFNPYGQYGSKYSSESAFNVYASDPPKIITKDGQWAFLTVNSFRTPGVSPWQLLQEISN